MCLAVPGKIQSLYVDHETPMGKVDFGGVIKEVCMVYLPECQIGDYVIVHVGFAINAIDEESAEATLESFAELGLLDQELDELRSTGDDA